MSDILKVREMVLMLVNHSYQNNTITEEEFKEIMESLELCARIDKAYSTMCRILNKGGWNV